MRYFLVTFLVLTYLFQSAVALDGRQISQEAEISICSFPGYRILASFLLLLNLVNFVIPIKKNIFYGAVALVLILAACRLFYITSTVYP